MQIHSSQVKTGLVAAIVVLLGTSFYLAHLSGRAMSAAVGDTNESLDLETLSAVAGLPAMVFGVSLLAAEQTGGVVLRVTKMIATSAVWIFLQVSASVLIQWLSAP
jgi:hypothetical protein